MLVAQLSPPLTKGNALREKQGERWPWPGLARRRDRQPTRPDLQDNGQIGSKPTEQTTVALFYWTGIPCLPLIWGGLHGAGPFTPQRSESRACCLPVVEGECKALTLDAYVHSRVSRQSFRARQDCISLSNLLCHSRTDVLRSVELPYSWH